MNREDYFRRGSSNIAVRVAGYASTLAPNSRKARNVQTRRYQLTDPHLLNSIAVLNIKYFVFIFVHGKELVVKGRQIEIDASVSIPRRGGQGRRAAASGGERRREAA